MLPYRLQQRPRFQQSEGCSVVVLLQVARRVLQHVLREAEHLVSPRRAPKAVFPFDGAQRQKILVRQHD